MSLSYSSFKGEMMKCKESHVQSLRCCSFPTSSKHKRPKAAQHIPRQTIKPHKTTHQRVFANATEQSTQPSPPQPESFIDIIESFRVEHTVPQGTLVITPLREPDVGAASVVLTRAFATSPQGIPFDDGKKYCQDMLRAPPHAVLLVGRLYPPSNSNDDNNADAPLPEWMPPGQQDSRLITTGTVSLHPIAREKFDTLQPPDKDAYVCNIAVDPKFRRKGYARKILAACEQLAAQCGLGEIYLHVRLSDEAARSLYASEGYEEVAADSFLVKLRSITPRSLQRKTLF